MGYTAAVIGTGPEPDDPGRDGYAMAYHHATGYEKLENCDLVACADLVRENAAAFAEEFELADDAVFESYERLLEAVEPDVVSVCVPSAHHARIVIDCVRSDLVDAVHCEKPIADRYNDARLTVQEANRHDVQVTFNHQRRFGEPFRRAKDLLDDGEIGELERLEFSAPIGVLEYGSHSFDLCNYYNDETPAEWVMAQVDYREENVQFGTHNENQAVVVWEYENGVHGLGTTNETDGSGPTDAVSCHNRLIGTEGTIEVGPGYAGDGDDEDRPTLRIRRAGDAEWEAVDVDGGLHDWGYVDAAIEDVVRCLETGEDPELGAENALNATEIIFAAWESSRRRGRVDLPLAIDDNPLAEMVESGELTPEPRASDE